LYALHFLPLINPLKLRERVAKDSRIVEAKKKLWGRNGRLIISGGRKSISLLQGSQVMPTCRSDKDRIRVKTLRA
jgi:hypothetical protein